MNKLEKNYLQVPINFMNLMDLECMKLMMILMQKESYWNAKNKLEDGFFSKSINELTEELHLKNRKDVRLVIEALYRAGYIEVFVIPQKTTTAKFRLNWEKIEEVANMTMQDVKEFGERVVKLPRTETPTYVTNCDTILGTELGTTLGTGCTTTIDNIDNINNKNNIDNINNILKEKENTITNSNSIKEKEITTVEIIEDMENEKEIKREIVSPANNGGYVLSSILVDWTGENVNEKKNNTTPTTGKSSEELERMMEEVIATSTGREEEASNFKMWVKLNKNDLNSAGLMCRAEEVFEILKNTPNKAILEPQTHQVEQESTSRGDALKTPKNSRYEQARKRTPSLPKCEVVDGQEYVCLECGERIPVRSAWEQEDRELEEIFASMEMANAC